MCRRTEDTCEIPARHFVPFGLFTTQTNGMFHGDPGRIALKGPGTLRQYWKSSVLETLYTPSRSHERTIVICWLKSPRHLGIFSVLSPAPSSGPNPHGSDLRRRLVLPTPWCGGSASAPLPPRAVRPRRRAPPGWPLRIKSTILMFLVSLRMSHPSPTLGEWERHLL